MKALPQISEAEFEVMKIVWKYAPINTNEVTERLTRTTDWHPKTIQTLLKRLVNKGALTYEKRGAYFCLHSLVHEKKNMSIRKAGPFSTVIMPGILRPCCRLIWKTTR